MNESKLQSVTELLFKSNSHQVLARKVTSNATNSAAVCYRDQFLKSSMIHSSVLKEKVQIVPVLN
jgi:hypothetical protein